MYKKKSKLPAVITGVFMVMVFAILIFLNVKKHQNDIPIEEPETEAVSHEVTLYKSSDAGFAFNQEYLKEDAGTATILSIPEDTFVTILVSPKDGKEFKDLDMQDTNLSRINYSVLDTETTEKRINFVMPKADVIMNFSFSDQMLSYRETETEETEGTDGYDITLHGVTSEILVSYNGLFDDKEFIRQFGDSLHVDSARSSYSDVTDITFEKRAYDGEQDSDKVYHYIYLNEDTERELLATFFVKEKRYVFSELPETEKERENETDRPEDAGGASGYGASGNGSTGGSSTITTGSAGSSSGSTGASGGETRTVTTSFDILKVSQNLLDYCGGKDKFYDKAFEYVLSKKLTGEIVGTMSSHKIDVEKEEATFEIKLNTGKTIKGTYNKKEKAYSYEGL